MSTDKVASAVMDSLASLSPGETPTPRVTVTVDESASSAESVVVMVECRADGLGWADRVVRTLNLAAAVRRRLVEEDPTLKGAVSGITEVNPYEQSQELVEQVRAERSLCVTFAIALLPETDEKTETPTP
jgi:hypothetical protein